MALHLLRGQAPAAATLNNDSPEPGRTQLGACRLNHPPGTPDRCEALPTRAPRRCAGGGDRWDAAPGRVPAAGTAPILDGGRRLGLYS
jgi:hypothetical protein